MVAILLIIMFASLAILFVRLYILNERNSKNSDIYTYYKNLERSYNPYNSINGGSEGGGEGGFDTGSDSGGDSD